MCGGGKDEERKSQQRSRDANYSDQNKQRSDQTRQRWLRNPLNDKDGKDDLIKDIEDDTGANIYTPEDIAKNQTKLAEKTLALANQKYLTARTALVDRKRTDFMSKSLNTPETRRAIKRKAPPPSLTGVYLG